MTQGIPPPKKRIRRIAKPGTPLFYRRFNRLVRAGFNYDEAHALAMRRIGTKAMLRGRKERELWIRGLLRAGLSKQDIADAIDALYLDTGFDVYIYFYPEEEGAEPQEYPVPQKAKEMVEAQLKQFERAELRPHFAEDISA